MASDELRSIGSTGFDHAGGTAFSPQSMGTRPQELSEVPSRSGDQVELSQPHELTLRLLRERILEHTRTNLQLDKPQISFVVDPAASMESFVGRVLSDQNLLAAGRRGHWPEVQIDAALEDGMTSGLEETLQVLFELDQLTETSWAQIQGFLAEFHRKVASAS